MFLFITLILSIVEIFFASLVRDLFLILVSLMCLAIILPLLSTALAIWEDVQTQIIKSLRRRKPSKISPLDSFASSIILRRISNLPLFKQVIRVISRRLRNEALKAGVYTHIDSIIALILLVIISLVVCTTTLMVLSNYAPTPLYMKLLIRQVLMNLLPLLPLIIIILLLSPMIYLQIKKMNRVSEVQDELPFFILYASLIQEAGLSLYHAFERIMDKKVFKALEKEAKHLIRLFTFFVHSPIEALDEYANLNPNDTLRNVIKGYTSILRSGGEVTKYLENVSEKLLNDYVNKWKSYVRSVMFFGEILISVFTLFPLLFILGAIAFSQPMSKYFMILYIAIGVPVITIIVYAFIGQFQPRSGNITKIPVRILVLSMLTLIIMLYALVKIVKLEDMLTAISIALITSLIPLTIASRAIFYEIKSIDKALPQFLRDITEYIKIGYDVTQAIGKIAETRRYNRFFDNIVRSIDRLLKMNIPLTIIAEFIETRCWMFKYSLFIVSELANVGALTPEPLERLCNAIETAMSAKYEAKASLTTYVFLIYITPLFLAILAYFTSSMVLGASGMAMGIPLVNVKLVKELVYLTNVLALVVAISLGILLSKLRDQTISNTFHILILLIITILAFRVQEMITIQTLPLPMPSVGG